VVEWSLGIRQPTVVVRAVHAIWLWLFLVVRRRDASKSNDAVRSNNSLLISVLCG